MKQINITFTNEEYNFIENVKSGTNLKWHDFLLAVFNSLYKKQPKYIHFEDLPHKIDWDNIKIEEITRSKSNGNIGIIYRGTK